MAAYTCVGVSSTETWEVAGREAAGRALSLLNGNNPKLMIVMCTEDVDYLEAYRGVRTVCRAPVIGANAKYLYTYEGFFNHGTVVAVACLWDGELIGPAAYHRDSGNQRSEFADQLLGYRDRYDVSIFTLWAGFNYIQDAADEWYNTLGPRVHIFGGGSRAVYLEDRMYSDGGVAVAFASRDKFEYVLGHGSKPVGRPVVITRSEGNVIHEIDGIRASEVYDRIVEDIIRKYEKDEHAAEVDLYFAFGYPAVNGEYLLQEPILIDREKGTVATFLSIPSNSVVRTLVGRRDMIFSHSREMVGEYVRMFGKKPSFNFIINCVGRMDSLIELSPGKELEIFKEYLDAGSFFAFSSIGELGIPKGMPVYNHQKTLILFGAA